MERSFGVIPLKMENNRLSVFIIQNYSDAWLLPKGHAQEAETPHETAKRELCEETGLRVVKWLSFEPFKEEYAYLRLNHRVLKQVDYFPAIVEGQIVLQEEEIKAGRWVLLERLEQELTFPELQAIARRVVMLYS